MSTHANTFVAGLKVPTQSASLGAKTTNPLDASALPWNFQLKVIVELMSTQLKLWTRLM